MAATDKHFNNQRTLDIVFAVSNILMLLSVIWMFWQDHFREYKVEQRLFRNVEVAIAQRQALGQIPLEDEFKSAEDAVDAAKSVRFSDANKDEYAKAKAALAGLQPKKERAEARFQEAKADVDSINSFLNIALEHGDSGLADKYRKQLKELDKKLEKVQADRDDIVSKMKGEQVKIEKIDGPYTKAVAEFKKLNDKLDAQVKLALNKRWGWGDWLRTQPVINGFAEPLKIHQFTIEDIPIDYNFKKVTRFDRCMTCHVGIDKPAFTRANLEALTKDDARSAKLDEAKKLYDRRVKALEKTPGDAATIPNPHDVRLINVNLSPARVTEFCAHPRLDLFVGSNSKHPAEKFGCTSCHSGQGSGTSFNDASHSPNDIKTRNNWTHDKGWEHNHMWDFPMNPLRFVESSCLKCHHEVTDLVSRDNRVEAPKLLRGHGLIRENGCFGCHEIDGWKGGQRVGPDLRVEPTPPLEDLHPIERNRVENDPDNRPGGMRKVGPALARISEKVSQSWMEKWIRSPSAFRPDTKMPHYYGLSTNDVKFLKETAPDHEKDVVERFPDTEIASIAYFLTQTSKEYLSKADQQRVEDAKDSQASQKDQQALVEFLNKGRLDENDQKQFKKLKDRIKLRKEVPLVDLSPKYPGNIEKGRVLFTERGCLACHTHQATEIKQNSQKPEFVAPGIHSEATFGPNLTQVAEKLGKSPSAHIWLRQWIVNPQVHSPRSRMPVTHLTNEEAADIAAWLLKEPAGDSVGPDWTKLEVAAPASDDLKNLARVYLTRMMSKSDMEKFLKGELTELELNLIRKDIPDDEFELAGKVKSDDALKFYLGKKAVSRLGCFGCHDIPGFENTKSIGVALNDWGKKPADRLAFEDIKNFYGKHYYPVESLTGKDGVKDAKEPYEEFYREALIGHFPSREGYLNQKIRDPRSYDFNRVRAWDDRARMPQFTFARPRKKAEEKDDDFKARIFKDEAEARESVATFVLGLVAEPVPVKSINQPTGDRLAEVKGRQILDKYNCGGCHTIRPGVYDFKPGTKTLEHLNDQYQGEEKDQREKGEIIHFNHVNWIGRNPAGSDRLTVYSTRANFQADEAAVVFRLTEALQFRDKGVKNIPAGALVQIPVADMGADPASIKTQADFDRRFQGVAPHGGAFTDLMVDWLFKKNPQRYPLGGDAADARSALPPSLVGQGERTQPEWLYQFLLNPQQVRRMTILRMPKFNMSKEEAKALVDYFAAVARQTNPGIGLSYPHEVIAGREDFSGDYWKKKTAEYIEQLKNAKEKGKDGKETGATLYTARLAAYKPLWEEIFKEREPALKASLSKLDELIKTSSAAKDEKQKALDNATDPVKKEVLKKELEALANVLTAAAEERTQTATALSKVDLKSQQELWETQEAYAADAFRLLTSRDLCTKCHQVGKFPAGEQLKQGPPLDLVAQRLRPDWLERWVDKPTRFLPYASIMPPYFSTKDPAHQALHAGPAELQIRGLRDALLNLPRVSDVPVNRLHSPDRK